MSTRPAVPLAVISIFLIYKLRGFARFFWLLIRLASPSRRRLLFASLGARLRFILSIVMAILTEKMALFTITSFSAENGTVASIYNETTTSGPAITTLSREPKLARERRFKTSSGLRSQALKRNQFRGVFDELHGMMPTEVIPLEDDTSVASETEPNGERDEIKVREYNNDQGQGNADRFAEHDRP